jgi:HK97 family phage major capsid protein
MAVTEAKGMSMDKQSFPDKILNQRHFRMSTLNRESVDIEKRTVALSFASETPVERWWGFEILDHSPEMVNLTRWQNKPPFMENHYTRRGVIENGAIVDRQLVGTARLSRNPGAEELLRDIADGIAVHTSNGYIIHEAREMKPEEMSPELKTKCLEEGLKAYRCSWEPIEGSSVDIPADITVGLDKRGLDFYDLDDISDVTKIVQAIRSFIPPSNPADSSLGAGTEAIPQPSIRIKEATMEELTKTLLAPPTAEELLKIENARVAEITAIGTRFADRITGGKAKMDQLTKDAIELKRSLEQFRGDVYLRVNDSKPLETPQSFLGLSDKEVKRYRMRNVVLAQMKRIEPNLTDVHGNKVDTGFEEECSAALDKTVGPAFRGGLHVPYDIQAREMAVSPRQIEELDRVLRQFGIARRDLTVGAQHAAGDLVGTTLMGGSFIELLRNKMLAFQLGVKRMTGLVGNIAIPKQTTAGTFYYVAENTAPAGESAIVTSQVTMTPRTGGMYMDYSRQLLLQSTPSIDMLVQDDIAQECALGIDKAVFHGSGAPQPTGIVGVNGVGSVSGAGFGWEQAVEFETDVASANADVATMSYVMGAAARGILKGRLKALNTAEFLIDRDQRMNGYPVNVTNQIDAGYIFFGDWAQAIVGEWGSLDILVDPYTGGSAGTIRVRGFVSFDVAVRHAGAFSICSDLS